MAGGASCGGSAKARKLRAPRLRALVFLRDGLTTDSTGRTLPGHERAAGDAANTPTTLTIHPALGARQMATFRYGVSRRPPFFTGSRSVRNIAGLTDGAVSEARRRRPQA